MKKFLILLSRSAATIVIVLLAAYAAWWMWQHYETSPWTRDGRVRADVVRVTPDISGLVTEVHVVDNQTVTAGDLLFVIDRPRYELALKQARTIVASAKAALAQDRREADRDVALGELVAREAHEQHLARILVAEASFEQAEAAEAVAALNLKRTEIRASVNGTVTNLDLHPGDFVGAGQQAMALVDADSLRVEGYFEETKLAKIHKGARVKVRLMGEQRDLDGMVESIAAGINVTSYANSANLLPNVDPTFSWVRLAQRIPVRVRLENVPADVRLIVGRTATVTIIEDKE